MLYVQHRFSKNLYPSLPREIRHMWIASSRPVQHMTISFWLSRLRFGLPKTELIRGCTFSEE